MRIGNFIPYVLTTGMCAPRGRVDIPFERLAWMFGLTKEQIKRALLEMRGQHLITVWFDDLYVSVIVTRRGAEMLDSMPDAKGPVPYAGYFPKEVSPGVSPIR